MRAGEIIFVPAGWWHCVLNLEDGVAVTHNHCSPAGLPRVLAQLRDAPHTVSGVPPAHAPRLYAAFRAALAAAEPELLRSAEEQGGGGAVGGAPVGGGAEAAAAAAAAAAHATAPAEDGAETSLSSLATAAEQRPLQSAWARARAGAAEAASFSLAAGWGE